MKALIALTILTTAAVLGWKRWWDAVEPTEPDPYEPMDWPKLNEDT